MDFQPPGVNETNAGPILALKVVSTAQGPAAKVVKVTQGVVLETCFSGDPLNVTGQEFPDEESKQTSSELSGHGDVIEANDTELSPEADLSEDPDEDSETLEEWKGRVANFFRQMMFVSGETAEPSVETTTLIEEIVRQQVIEMVSII